MDIINKNGPTKNYNYHTALCPSGHYPTDQPYPSHIAITIFSLLDIHLHASKSGWMHTCADSGISQKEKSAAKVY